MKVSKFLVSSLFFAALTLGFASCNNEENPDDPFGGGTNNGGGNDTPGNTETTAKGDGTEANPYNVQFLLDLKTNGELAEKDAGTEKAWVEGYIVGSYVFDNDPKFVIGAEPNDQNNVLIADDANSTDTYAVSALKLGNFKTLVNLKDVPANLKKKIKVYGVVEKYCGISGVVNLEKVFIDGTEVELPGVTDVEVNDNMTPSEANAAATQLQAGATSSNKAGVVGYVSKIATAYSSQYNNITIYMSDNKDTEETFYVYRMSGGETLQVGDKIKVTGNLTNYKGTSPQMNTGATYELLEAAGGSGEEGGSEGEGEGEGEGSGSEGAALYTLDTTDAANKGTDNSYAGSEDITINSITWNVTGNTTMAPWRIGGKNLDAVNREVFTKTAYSKALTKIVVTLGTKNITLNSCKLLYSTNADFTGATEVPFEYTQGAIELTNSYPANCYYKLVFNCTETTGSNKYVQLSKIEFYGE